MDLTTLSRKDATLIQVALRELGFYAGTTRGVPGPKTNAAYAAYLAKGTASSSSWAEAFAAAADKEVGTKEEGNNGGTRIREYQRATWLAPGAWPWCAAFVCWCFRQAEETAKSGLKRPQTAGAWDFERWARDNGAKLINPGKGLAKRGDIVVYTFSHIGIVVQDQVAGETVLHTVEGNTNEAGSREGDGVWKKTRAVNKVRSLIRV